LEERVVGFWRGADIPGRLIPALYRRFLRERRSQLLEPVLRHNLWDIVSLAALTLAACRIVDEAEVFDPEEGGDP
jgi:hypothetical protein